MRATVLLLALSIACHEATPAASSAPAAPAPEEPNAAGGEPADHHGIAWYEDAPDAAFSAASKLGKPVLVDLWAPWCHTCLSMRHFVLTRANLAELAGRFVFLSINTERAENAPLLEKLPIEAWPTFYVVDAASGAPCGRWVGAASSAQFAGFLRDGMRAFDAGRASSLSPSDPLSLLLEGDALMRSRDHVKAADKYAAAIQLGGEGWARRPDAWVARLAALAKAQRYEEGAAAALLGMTQVGRGISAADFASHALGCAEKLDTADPRVSEIRTAAARTLSPLCEAALAELSPDDRSDACVLLSEARSALGDTGGAQAALRTRLTVLEEAAKGLPDQVALTYDWARAETLLELARGPEAIAQLEARERALPNDYNPPHYLARVYKELRQPLPGLVAVERALAKAYGPRRAAILGLKADLLLLKGDRAGAHAVLVEQLAAHTALPVGQKQEAREGAVRRRLAEWR